MRQTKMENVVRCRAVMPVTVMLLLTALIACKVSRWRKNDASPSAGSEIILPRQVAGADPNGTTGTAFDVDDKTGRPKGTLTLRLDYFPQPAPGSATLPACYSGFPPDFDLGFVVCSDKPGEHWPLAGRNVEQDCYTDPKIARLPASQPVTLIGCKRGMLLVHTFEPRVTVDVEVRDVN